MSDITGIVNQTGVALEATAFNMFGAAVQNQITPKLNDVLGLPGQFSGTQPRLPRGASGQDGVWDPTPYASAFTTTAPGNYDPKIKFMFTVEFEFDPAIAQESSSLGVDVHDFDRDISYVIKQIDLPTYEFEYEEVNMYNFRTKVLKSIRHRELNFSFYDDVGNHAMSFANMYMQMLTPINRSAYLDPDNLENHGFAFNHVLGGLDTSLRSALPSNRKNIIRKMRINQFYLKRSSSGSPDQGILFNTFTFTNPRLTTIDIADQDHETGGVANTIAATFDFDAINITTGQRSLDYKGLKNPNGDILQATAEAAAQVQTGNVTTAGKAGNPFVNIIARQGQRLVETSVSSALNRTLGGVAGGALGGVNYQVTGALGVATNRTLNNVGSQASQSLSFPTSPFVRDNSTPASQINDLSSRTTSLGGPIPEEP